MKKNVNSGDKLYYIKKSQTSCNNFVSLSGK